MARYVDADDLKAVIHANDWSNPVVPDVVSVIIDRTPAADVAPRSETSEAVEKIVSATDKVICEAKAEVAREIFEEIEKYAEQQIEVLNIAAKVDASGIFIFYGEKQALRLLLDHLAELKKKYTEPDAE